MRKSTRIVKRTLALFLVVLMSIENFAAVVGDNDGAAFITKAEFDSLKNNFQSQIDQYNTSIDSKIDGAIASYLSGIRVAVESTLVDLTKSAKEKSAYNVGFVSWATPLTTRDVPDVQAGLFWCYICGASAGQDMKNDVWSGASTLNNGQAWAGGLSPQRYHNWDESSANYNSYLYLINFPFGQSDAETRQTVGNITDWTLNSVDRFRCYFKLQSLFTRYHGAGKTITETPNFFGGSTITSDFTQGTADYVSGPGFGNDTVSRKLWLMDGTPTLSISHSWTSWNDLSSTTASIKLQALKLNYLFAGTIDSTCKAVDFAFRDAYTAVNPFEFEIASKAPATTTSGESPGEALSYHRRNDAGTGYAYFSAEYGKAAYLNNVRFLWKWNRQTIYTLDWDHLCHAYYNGVFSEPYYKYYGLPLCRTTGKPGRIKIKLKFTNKVLSTNANLSPSSSNGAYTYVIADKKFNNGLLPEINSSDSYWRDTDGYDHVLVRGARNTGSYEWTTDWIEIDKTKITNSENGDYIYVKVSPQDTDQVVSVEVVDTITYTET